MKTLIDVPLNLLTTPDGSRLVSNLSGTYYGNFLNFLKNPVDNDEFRKSLLASNVVASTRFRAKCIWLAAYLEITYDEAHPLVGLVDLEQTDTEAADLVMKNYLAMLAKPNTQNIFVKIDEFGRAKVIEGLHRAVIAYARGFESIPAKVLTRHPEWLSLVDFFRGEGERYYGSAACTYQKIFHPDFADYSVVREDRSGPILNYLKEHAIGVSGLEIGSHVGFFSHALGCAGYQMQAIEYEEKYASAFAKLAILYGSGAEITRGDVYNIDIPSNRYQFLIALSIIYHLLRNNELKCIEFIEDLKMKIPLFFIDTEERTGILTEQRLRSLFGGYQFTSIYIGRDDRQIFAIERGS